MFTTENGARPDIPNIIILITDGKANVQASMTEREANLTKAADITIFTIGVTNNIDVHQLSIICTYPPATHFFYSSDFISLRTILNEVLQRTCNEQLITSFTDVIVPITPLPTGITVPDVGATTQSFQQSTSVSTAATTTAIATPLTITTTRRSSLKINFIKCLYNYV